VQELSNEITLSRDHSGMQHELIDHFFQALGKNSDSGLTRSVLLPNILKIKQLRRSPTHPMLPLPFTYHDVLLMLRDAEITHFHTGTGSGLAQAFVNTTPGVHDPVVAASQMRPNKAHQSKGLTYPSRPFPKVDGAQMNFETTGGYASFLNEKVERPNRTLSERARCMLLNAVAPAQDWCSATEHAADIYRATYHSAIKCAPHVAWYVETLNTKDMHIWGC
jgi:hypothetical protein